MTAPAVRLENVIVRRRGRRILAVPDFEIPSGSFFGIVGPNGAGKSTLLKVLGAALLPDSGRVTVLDVDVTSVPRYTLPSLRRRVACVPQSLEFNRNVPLMTREIVAMGVAGRCGLFRWPGDREQELLDRWIERLGLAGLQHQTFHSLSGGEQQKALLARAMVQEPDLLLLDEPTANLDINWKEQLGRLVTEIHDETGLTVAMVSHESGYIPDRCSQVALMKNGEIHRVTDRETALSPDMLAKLHDERVSPASAEMK